MRVDRYAVMLALGTPALLVAISMLARTELFVGDAVRRAVQARAAAIGADVEILTVSPSGLRSIELEHVSVRIPRGDFAAEMEFESVVVTPAIGSLFGAAPTIVAVELRNGAISWVPWTTEPEPVADAPPTTAQPEPEAAPPESVQVPPREAIALTFRNVDVVAYSERYEVLPLHLGRLAFEWTRDTPIRALAGYGELPDGVAFSIAADADKGAYHLRPQSRTRIDRWVAPRRGGVGWPVAISTQDVRVCLDCASIVALEDVEISVPRWREDVRLTAPTADVWRRGGEVGLGALEMGIVDTDALDFAARLTETELRYAVDTGRLGGAIEVADRAGGLLGVTWEWDGSDFDATFSADRFQLRSIWHLVGLGDLARPTRIDGHANVGWDVRLQTVGADADLQLDELVLLNPWTDEIYELADGRFELDVFFDVRGRALSLRRAALTVGDARPLTAAALLVEAGEGVAFEGEFSVARQDVQTLVDALPSQLTEVFHGAELEGSLGLTVSAVGHSGFPEALVLRKEIDSDVRVVSDGARADVAAIGAAGPPPGHTGDWHSLASIGRTAWEIVLAAEDAKFMEHSGFDWTGIERAMVHNLKVGRPERGGSTISQQVAKNLFLDQKRTLSRKLQEAYLTWRLEETLSKRRILEIYLNIAEWGSGTRGLTAAADRYYDSTPRRLTVPEVALLAAILPNPHRFGGWIEDGKLATSRLEKFERVLRNLRFMKKITPDDYRRWWREAKSGEIGRLQLTICSDTPDDAESYPACS